MMTRQFALNFAKASAFSAWDQREEYSDPVASYRENVTDTLNDEKANDFVHEALEVFDHRVKELFGKQLSNYTIIY